MNDDYIEKLGKRVVECIEMIEKLQSLAPTAVFAVYHNEQWWDVRVSKRVMT